MLKAKSDPRPPSKSYTKIGPGRRPYRKAPNRAGSKLVKMVLMHGSNPMTHDQCREVLTRLGYR